MTEAKQEYKIYPCVGDDYDPNEYGYVCVEEADEEEVIVESVSVENVARSGADTIKVSLSALESADAIELQHKVGSTGDWEVLDSDIITTTYNHTNVAIGVTHYYRARAIKDGNAGEFSATKSIKLNVTAPTISSVTKTAATTVTLKWSTKGYADSYKIYFKKGSSGTWKLLKSGVTAKTYKHTNVTVGYTYYYKIKAVHKGALSDYSASKSIKIPVGKVTNLKATTKGAKSIKLTWNGVTGATGYQIYRYNANSGAWVLKKTTTAKSWTNTGLTKNKSHKYKVRAYKSVNGSKVTGNYSAVVTGIAGVLKTNIKSITSKVYSVKVAWNKSTNASGYEVYRAKGNGSFKKVKTIKKGSTLSYNNTGLSSGKKYRYKVRAYRYINGKKLYSPFSGIKSIKTKLTSVSTYNVSFTAKNQTKKIKVTYTGSNSVWYHVDNTNVVTAKWSRNWNNDVTTLILTANNPGTTYVKVTNDDNNEVHKIKVTVVNKWTVSATSDMLDCLDWSMTNLNWAFDDITEYYMDGYLDDKYDAVDEIDRVYDELLEIKKIAYSRQTVYLKNGQKLTTYVDNTLTKCNNTYSHILSMDRSLDDWSRCSDDIIDLMDRITKIAEVIPTILETKI